MMLGKEKCVESVVGCKYINNMRFFCLNTIRSILPLHANSIEKGQKDIWTVRGTSSVAGDECTTLFSPIEMAKCPVYYILALTAL